MESNTMHRHVVARCACALAIAIAAVALLRTASAQTVTTQIDLTGSWLPLSTEDVSNDTYPVDYMALPLSDEGRVRALSYNESQLSMIDRQCEGRPVWYFVQGPFGFTLWRNTDPTKGQATSYTIGAWENRLPMTIWMDGRPQPSKYAEHSRAGFTTGRWEGNTLVATTTNMKASYIRKNGPPMSDHATVTTRYFRHGDLLTVLLVIEDPYYLAEPYTITKTFERSPTEITTVGPPCISTFEGTALDAPTPHWNPDKNPFVDELTKKWGIPREVVLGYPETLYPDYRQKLKNAR